VQAAPAPAPTVVVQQPVPVIVPAPTPGEVIVTYTTQSYQLAQQTAANYCAQHYGATAVRLLSDNRVGSATYACVM
jgi:hypothetical protein